MRFRDLALLALCLALAGCGKKGSKGVDSEAPPQDLPAESQSTVVRAGSVELPAGAAVLKPRDALETYFKGRGVAAGRAERLLRHADRMMEEVELE